MKPVSFLLVDDNEIALREISNVLRYLSFKDVHEASSADMAWKTIKAKPVDCVIADWEMPDMSGLALLKIVRQDDRFFKLPFFLTHDAFTKVKVVQAGQSGVTGLLVKPFDVNNIKVKLLQIASMMGEVASIPEEEVLEEGLRLIESKEYGKALELFNKLVSEGETAEYYYNIGYIKTSQKKYGEAIDAFQKATQLDHLFAKAFEAMGRIYTELGQPEKAESFLQKAADIYITKENMEDAESILNEILEANVTSVNVYNSLGVLYRKKGDLKTALANYQKAIKVHPTECNIHYNIGRIFLEMQDMQSARQSFIKAIEIKPDFNEAKEVLHAINIGAI